MLNFGLMCTEVFFCKTFFVNCTVMAASFKQYKYHCLQ